MPYTALPDRRIPYDNDGTVVGVGRQDTGLTSYPTQATLQEWQDEDYAASTQLINNAGQTGIVWSFFPEQREVTAYHAVQSNTNGDSGVSGPNALPTHTWQGSNDTTNGVDGTWETASLPAGQPQNPGNPYEWRSNIKPISFTGGKRTVQWRIAAANSGNNAVTIKIAHLYGEKVTGQTPDDVIYIDHDTTPGIEYTAPEDFGDQPLGTTVVRQFRLKNASATKTANAINVQCNDADFAISTDGTTWVVTINIASLGPGAQSATMYVRCTTPAPGNLLGPRFARIVTTVASYT